MAEEKIINETPERHNPCVNCGCAVKLVLDEFHEFDAKCSSCGCSIGLGVPSIPGQNATGICRGVYNTVILGEGFENRAFAKMGLTDGGIIFADVDDGFFEFCGTPEAMIDFIAYSQKNTEKNTMSM